MGNGWDVMGIGRPWVATGLSRVPGSRGLGERVSVGRMRTRARWLVLVALWGCPDDENCPSLAVTSDVACETTQACVDAKLPALSCVNGFCRLPCVRDSDCVLERASDDSEACKAEGLRSPPAVCENQVCVAGCPDAPCAAGETCVEGRCAVAFEGFEARDGDAPDLSGICWNGLANAPDDPRCPGEGWSTNDGRILNNTRTRIAWKGPRGCSLGDFNCAGPAAGGDRFVVLGTEPTRSRATPETAATCRACACCVQCSLDPPDAPPSLDQCPGGYDFRTPLMCLAVPPPVCADVCSACEACPDAGRPMGQRLAGCEVLSASRGCDNCLTCDQAVAACRTNQCPVCASQPSSQECNNCVSRNCLSSNECMACDRCREAADCARVNPAEPPPSCAPLLAACDALGAASCYFVPVSYPRGELTVEEQSLISPRINLSGQSGSLVLELQYVAFDVGPSYRRGIEGQPPEAWPVEPQEVRIELCARNCGQASSWIEATLDGGASFFPPLEQRSNGLLLSSQTSVDWRAGLVRVILPPDMLTSEFRFRLVPRLGEDARVGIDQIFVRRP